MKIANKSVEMTCTLVLGEREIEMLAWMAGFGADVIARAIAGQLTSRFDDEEWRELWSQFRTELERTERQYSDVRMVFAGSKRAV